MKSYIPVMLKYNASENTHADVELFSSIELYFLVILQIREQHEQEAATHPLAP